MIKEGNIYVVTGYIPSDENKVVIDIYQLFRIGSERFRWYWGNVSNGSGIGFLTENGGHESSEDALIAINGFTNDVTKMGRWTFEEMLDRYNTIKNELQSQLK